MIVMLSIGLFAYLLVLGAGRGRDWEAEDAEQAEYLRRCRERKQFRRRK